MNKAVVIGHITVKDQDKWAVYRSMVPATLEPWGGELLFRGTRSVVLAGGHQHDDTVVIHFPNLDSVKNWYASAEYQSLIPIRTAAADIDLIAYEE